MQLHWEVFTPGLSSTPELNFSPGMKFLQPNHSQPLNSINTGMITPVYGPIFGWTQDGGNWRTIIMKVVNRLNIYFLSYFTLFYKTLNGKLSYRFTILQLKVRMWNFDALLAKCYKPCRQRQWKGTGIVLYAAIFEILIIGSIILQ